MIIKKRHKQAEIIQQPAVQQILDTPLQAPNDVVVPKTESVEIKKEKPTCAQKKKEDRKQFLA